jgi:uncharacterized protein (TIGR03083 family)
MIHVIDLFNGERMALLDLLRSLREDEWWLPTVCGDWTVHDVALHLIGADVNVLSRDRDQFDGPPSLMPPGDLSDWPTLVDFIDRRNEVWVDAMRRVSPQLTIQLLETTGTMLDHFWPTLDLAAPGPPVSWAGPEPATLWVHVYREYTERWTHQQHIRDACGRPGLTGPEWLGPVLEAFMLALPRALRDTGADPGTAVEVRLTGPAGGAWWAVRQADSWTLQRSSPGEASSAVTMDQDTAWRLFSRGIDPAEAANSARIDGDEQFGLAVLQMVSIIA